MHRKQRLQIQVEELEARYVPAFLTYHGGPLIANVQVETVYLGQAWADQAAAEVDDGRHWPKRQPPRKHRSLRNHQNVRVTDP